MALSNASSFNTDATSLLKFIDTAACDIQDHMSNCGKSKRKFNMRKYISRNLKPAKKRLGSGGPSRAGAMTKKQHGKSAAASALMAAGAPVLHCPVTSGGGVAGGGDSGPLPAPAWMTTASGGYLDFNSSNNSPSNSPRSTVSSLYSPYLELPVLQQAMEPIQPPPVQSTLVTTTAAPGSMTLDPDVREILSEFSCDVTEPLCQSIRSPHLPHQSSLDSQASSTCTLPQQSSLESQVYLGEYPYSPYSDCSDEILDSAYSSPSSSSYGHHSPESLYWVGQVAQTCGGASGKFSSSSVCNSVCDQGLPSTPTWDSFVNLNLF